MVNVLNPFKRARNKRCHKSGTSSSKVVGRFVFISGQQGNRANLLIALNFRGKKMENIMEKTLAQTGEILFEQAYLQFGSAAYAAKIAKETIIYFILG